MIERNNNFDFIRFIAATLVIFSHSFPLATNSYIKEPMANFSKQQMSFGDVAVAVFFIVSGYLITMSYERKQKPFDFIVSRFLRIFPALIVVVLITTFIFGPILTVLPLNVYFSEVQTYQYLKNILLFPNQYYLPGVFEDNIFKGVVNGSLWTLLYEFICYAIVLIMGITKTLNKKYILVVFLVTLSFYSMKMFPVNDFVYKLLYLFQYFSAGMCIYMYRDKVKVNHKIGAISLIVLLLASRFGGLAFSFVIFGSYFIYYIALTPMIKLSNFSKYGDISYGLYIFAFPIQQLIVHLNGGSMGIKYNFIATFFVTSLISLVSWFFIEKPFLKLKKTIIVNRIKDGSADMAISRVNHS